MKPKRSQAVGKPSEALLACQQFLQQQRRNQQQAPLPVETFPFNCTQQSYYSELCDTIYDSLPIPPQVVPVLASAEEIAQYESIFDPRLHNVENMTMERLLQFFNQPHYIPGQTTTKSGKIVFLSHFIKKLMETDKDYNLAILCNNLESEETLDVSMDKYNFNIERTSRYFGRSKNLFGLMVKIRSNAKYPSQYTPIKNSNIDYIFIYDSACHVNHTQELKLFNTHLPKKPMILYLTCMDSPEIRVHTFNRLVHNNDQFINWRTEMGDIDEKLKEIILLQPNRKPASTFWIGWNDTLSQHLLNWTQNHPNQQQFQCVFPKKGGLLQEVLKFRTHHPIILPTPNTNSVEVKNESSSLAPASTVKDPTTLYPNPSSYVVSSNRSTSSGVIGRGTILSPSRPSAPYYYGGIHPDRQAMLRTENSSSSNNKNTTNYAPSSSSVTSSRGDAASGNDKNTTTTEMSFNSSSLKRSRWDEDDVSYASKKLVKTDEAAKYQVGGSSVTGTAKQEYISQSNSSSVEPVTPTNTTQQQEQLSSSSEPIGHDSTMDIIEKALAQFEADILNGFNS